MNQKNKFYTDFLFSTNDFIIGAGSAINLAGNYYDFNGSESAAEADERAIRNDFSMIGQDLCEATENFRSYNKLIEPAF